MKCITVALCVMYGAGAFAQEPFQSDNRNSVRTGYGLFYPLKALFKNPLADRKSALPGPLPSIGIGLEHPR